MRKQRIFYAGKLAEQGSSTSIRQTRPDGKTICYASGQEVEVQGNNVTVKTYWPANLGVKIDRVAGGTELNWTHTDRLSSVVGITDSWGKLRTPNGAPGNGTPTPDNLDGVTDNKGYTGHEMLDQLDLVHMNGRIYDPLVARMMSADPYIQDPLSSQSYNRYTYVWNNPTNITDPTGFGAATFSSTSNGITVENTFTQIVGNCPEEGVCGKGSDGSNWQLTSTKVSNEQGQSRTIDWTGGR